MELLNVDDALKALREGKTIYIVASMNTAKIRRDLNESRIWYCGTFFTQKKFKEMFGPTKRYGKDGFYLYDEWLEEDKKKHPNKYPNN